MNEAMYTHEREGQKGTEKTAAFRRSEEHLIMPHKTEKGQPKTERRKERIRKEQADIRKEMCA